MQKNITPPLKTAVLLLVFNRPSLTAQVFEAISKAKPPKLYVAADGPRSNHEGEAEKVTKVRQIATSVDWPCEVKTLFRDINLGCKYAVSGAITWFFEQEEQGIILEDDCLPHSDFFIFCETLLERYADDGRVSAITGNNFQNGFKRGDGSYYFSRYNHVWGWASWRRAWEKADMDIKFWPKWKNSQEWFLFWTDSVARKYWVKIFDRMYRLEFDTWDYPWMASVWYYGGLTATPNVNLVSNIGFGSDATHTKSVNSPLFGMATKSLGELIHPSTIRPDATADRFVFDNTFNGKMLRFPYSFFRLPIRVRRFVFNNIKHYLNGLKRNKI